jgi:hypothetical protein
MAFHCGPTRDLLSLLWLDAAEVSGDGSNLTRGGT